jgi:hypothetical protein
VLADEPTPVSTTPVDEPPATPPPVGGQRRNRRISVEEEVPHPAVAADDRTAQRVVRQQRPAHVPLHPPPAPRDSPASWPVPPRLIPVSEHRVGEFTLCVPTSVAELGLWSRRLSNCLDTFGPAVAHGRSWVIGIRRSHEMVGAIEICPENRRLRQCEGRRNRALPEAVYALVIPALGELGVLRMHRAH